MDRRSIVPASEGRYDSRNSEHHYIQKDAFAYYDRHTGTLGEVATENPTAPQLIIGSDGKDTLVGGPNNDILVAGKGQQTLTGGSGSDTFDFSQQSTHAVITDFNVHQDKLEVDLSLLQNGQPWRISSDKGNTLIQGNDVSVELEGVTPSQLSASDFVLPSQSDLVSKSSLLAQFVAAGFQGVPTTSSGVSNAVSQTFQSLATNMNESVLAPSTSHAHA